MSRIELKDTGLDVITKMSDGNPGALGVMMEIIGEHDKIDPEAAMGAIGAIALLDSWGIYGTDIYILYNDKCGRDVRKMLMLIRAVQLGFLSQGQLVNMAHDQLREVNLSDEEVENLDKKVCDVLESFAKPSVVA